MIYTHKTTTPTRKIAQYALCRGKPTEVEEAVNALLNEGWELNGSTFNGNVGNELIVIQSMVHSQSVEEEE